MTLSEVEGSEVEWVKMQNHNAKFKKKPFVTIKYAQTLDGKIADSKGRSRWISALEARRFAHRLRAGHQAVLIGVNTVLKDDPLLTVRLVKGENPIRIILDSKLRTPPKSKIVQKCGKVPTIIAVTPKASKKKNELFQRQGVEILVIPAGKKGEVNLRKLLDCLSKLKIKSLLVEGGSKIITSFLKERLADKIIIITAPKILGKGLDAIGDLGISQINKSLGFKLKKVKRIGKDLVIIGKVGGR